MILPASLNNALQSGSGSGNVSGFTDEHALMLKEIWQRVDLDRNSPNTHSKDSSRIVNGGNIDLVSTDNNDGTFTVQRQP